MAVSNCACCCIFTRHLGLLAILQYLDKPLWNHLTTMDSRFWRRKQRSLAQLPKYPEPQAHSETNTLSQKKGTAPRMHRQLRSVIRPNARIRMVGRFQPSVRILRGYNERVCLITYATSRLGILFPGRRGRPGRLSNFRPSCLLSCPRDLLEDDEGPSLTGFQLSLRLSSHLSSYRI